jgi:hypothetical protein
MAHLKPEFIQLTEDDIAAIVRLGREQAELMNAIETALQAGDDQRALELVRQMVGLEQRAREEAPRARVLETPPGAA